MESNSCVCILIFRKNLSQGKDSLDQPTKKFNFPEASKKSINILNFNSMNLGHKPFPTASTQWPRPLICYLHDPAMMFPYNNECISQQHPILVAIDGEQVVGYASFGSWRSGVGYKYTVEHSIHIRHYKRGLAIGSTLMTALIEHANNIGIHVMVAAVESNNKASIALHFKMGCTESGRFKEVGYKSGQWLDLVFLQKNLVN